MLTVNCQIDKKPIKLNIHEIALTVAEKTIPFISIKSMHIKNEEGYFLKLKLDGSVPGLVFEFSTIHLRDMTKNLLLDRIKVAENLTRNLLERNLDYKKAIKNTKGILSGVDAFVHSVDKHESLFFQKEIDTRPEAFFSMISQPLLDVFISMNCSIEQFYNLYASSYFYSIKNQKNSLDRLLAERLRQQDTIQTVQMDYATRINSHSLLSLAEATEWPPEIRSPKRKLVGFEPGCPFENLCDEEVQLEKGKTVQFEPRELTAEISVKDQESSETIPFESADFEAARELCRLVYASRGKGDLPDEVIKFSETLLSLVEGKYGKEAIKYVERLIPSFYYAS